MSQFLFTIFSTRNKEGPYHCKLCADSFFSESDLNNHEKTKHVKIQTYQCKICNYCSLEKSLMIRHMRTHSGQRPFYCKECGYAFTTKANCERHIRKRHNKGNNIGSSLKWALMS